MKKQNYKRQTKTINLPKMGEVTVTELSLGDILYRQKLDSDKQLTFLVAKALIEPKMSEDDILNLPVSFAADLEILSNAIVGDEGNENEGNEGN